ncbi:MAG: ATP-binding protein [Actinomycetota bacterium]
MPDLPGSFTRSEFAAYVEREHERVELKAGAGRRPLQECLVAFSNTDGGVIFIGVTDAREVRGRRRDQGLDDDIHGAAVDAHNVGRYAIHEITVDGIPVVAVQVQPRLDEVAATSDGRVLVRRGGHNLAAIGQELRALVNSRSLIRFESTDTGVQLRDADAHYLAEVTAAYGWAPSRRKQAMQERGLVTLTDTLTVAGVLALTDPAVSIGTAKFVVDVRGYESDTGASYVRRDEVGGPVHHQVEKTTELIMRDVGTDMVVTGAHRHDVPRLPRRAVREVIANAVAHRSYELDQSPIVVEVRPSQVTVVSPGSLPPPVTIRTLRHDQSPRNHTVIDVLRRFHLAEDSGQGIDVIEDSFALELLEPPTFSEQGEAVRVDLPMRGLASVHERAWLAEMERTGTAQQGDRLLLLAVLRHERLTNAEARRLLGEDSTAARARLQRLRDAGLLVQHGERGRAYYTLGALVPRTSDEQIVLAAAKERPVTNERVRALTGRDRVAARALLRRLVSEGRLRQHGVRRGTTYTLPAKGPTSGLSGPRRPPTVLP